MFVCIRAFYNSEHSELMYKIWKCKFLHIFSAIHTFALFSSIFCRKLIFRWFLILLILVNLLFKCLYFLSNYFIIIIFFNKEINKRAPDCEFVKRRTWIISLHLFTINSLTNIGINLPVKHAYFRKIRIFKMHTLGLHN